MKRFWKDVAVAPEGAGFGVTLDGRPLRTPARQPLVAPTESLAAAIAAEWLDSPEEVDPRSMPLTGLANAALDRVAPDPETFATNLARYGESDLLAYRAEGPLALAERQADAWDPLLQWARRRFDVDFATTAGVSFVAQPADTVRRLAHAVASHSPFQLAALSPLVTISGSLVIALAVIEGEVTAEQAWAAAAVDDAWQLEKWGEDAEAMIALGNRRRDFLSAARFLSLLD